MKEDLDLNAAIDAVANGMTAGQTRALRRKVLTEIETRSRARKPRWIAAGLVAVASAALLFLVARPRPDAALVQPHAAALPERSPIGPYSDKRIEPKVATVEARGRRLAAQAASSPAAGVPPSAEQLAWESRAIPPLEPPAALTLDEIQPEPLEIRPLVMTPLSVAPIELSNTGE